MRVAIVYESMFGNTHEVAEAIAVGVREAAPAADVALLPVAEAKAGQVGAVDLLIVGGPTHMRGVTSGASRRSGLESEQRVAAGRGAGFHPETGAAGPGVREWFQALPKVPPGRAAAAFDTRAHVRLAGGAARGIARRLRRHGYRLAAKPAGFIIDGTGGPLHEGESGRARAWGAALARERAHQDHS